MTAAPTAPARALRRDDQVRRTRTLQQSRNRWFWVFVGPFLLVEAPRLLFPFARQIIAGATQDLGFPPLMLDPIDFAAIFMAQMEQQQAAGGLPQGEPTVQ